MTWFGAFSVIFNPQARAGHASAYIEPLRKLTEERGGRLLLTQWAGHATELATQATRSQRALVFAAGGDDTVREVLNGINRSPETRIGFIPVGTFNNFATSLHLPDDPVQALREALDGRDYYLDLGKVENGPFFLESVGLGLDSEAWSQAPKQEPIGLDRWFTGMRVGFNALAKFLPRQLHITIDGKGLGWRDYMQVFIANSRCFGARLQVAPHACLDDGLLDVCLIPPLSRAKLLTALPLFFYGKQTEYLPIIRFVRCKKITIRAKKPLEARVDGLLASQLPMTVRAIHRALAVRLPASCFQEGRLRS